MPYLQLVFACNGLGTLQQPNYKTPSTFPAVSCQCCRGRGSFTAALALQ
jgi:hypothetical protein